MKNGLAPSLADRLAAAPTRDRAEVLKKFLCEKVSEVLGIEPWQIEARDNLMDLGVDSMKAVELKMIAGRELGLSLSSSLLFDYPNIEALAGFLLELTGPGVGEQPGSQMIAPWREQSAVAANGFVPPEKLSQERVAALLNAELEELGLRSRDDTYE
jgi:myxalamid-type polyketide synthase MxaB